MSHVNGIQIDKTNADYRLLEWLNYEPKLANMRTTFNLKQTSYQASKK